MTDRSQPWSLSHYRVISKLGAGGMGEVYLAEDTRLNRKVAIKLLPDELTRNEDGVQRFMQEARSASALNHPNIITVHDIGESTEGRFIVMELVAGTTLRALPRTYREVARLVPLFAQMAEALSAAHAAGITHRDLKPENIMVREDGYVKMLDFGLARLSPGHADDAERTVTRQTTLGRLVGTVKYMSPEQSRGETVGPPSDIFSLGMVFYELTAGRYPFTADTTLGYLHAITSQTAAPLSDVPGALESLITRMLAKDATARPTAGEVHAILAAIERGDIAPTLVPQTARQSIAVLPFANMSAEKDQEYFADGLADEIINLLAQVAGLKVIARTSAFAFRGKEQDVRGIAEILGVRTILEGSVRRAGTRVRVTAQLVNAADGSHLWSKRFDRELTDVFAVQDEIASAITAALQITFTAQSEKRGYKPAFAAYEALLKARYHFNQLTPESMARGLESVERAIILDPGFATPHAELSLQYGVMAATGMRPAHEVQPLAKAAAKRALALDPSIPEGLANLARITAFYEYDWKEGERLFTLAMARDAVPSALRQLYALYLLHTGRPGRGIEEMARALQEDPLNSYFRMILSMGLQIAGQDAQAAAECHRILEVDDSYFMAHWVLALIHLERGALEDSARAADKAHALAPWSLPVAGHLAGVLGRAGDASRASAVLGELGDGTAYGAPLGFVGYYLTCLDIDLAADWAEKAIAQRYPIFTLYLRLPLARNLRVSPRWPALAKMMNLPDMP
jgi:serine/threonine-protein kinase